LDRRSFCIGAGAAFSGVAVARTAEGEAARGDIVLGQSAVLSGPVGVVGTALRDGAQLVFEGVNAQGGVGGRRLRLVSLDDGLDPARAVANYKSLATEHRVAACLLGTGATTTSAAVPALREAGVPLVGAMTVSDSVRDASAGVAYYVRASQQRECEALVTHLTTLGIHRIGVAYFAAPGGEEVLRQLKSIFEQRGAELRGTAAVAVDGRNAAQECKRLVAQEPQAVVLFLSGAAAAATMDAIRSQGAASSFYGMSVLSGEVTARLLGGRAHGLAISEVIPYPWDGASPEAVQYRRAAEHAGVPIGYHSFEGWLVARVLVEALSRAAPEPTRARLHATLRAMKLRVAGMDLDFTGGRHTGSHFVELVHVRDNGSFAR
jgi:ABC-type branched-subunit amino acid transport system substrate-binding protein